MNGSSNYEDLLLEGFAPSAARDLQDLVGQSDAKAPTGAAAPEATTGPAAKPANGAKKISYAISCSSRFRDAIQTLADRRDVNVGDIARSVMLTLPVEAIDAAPDPGEPAEADRETIYLKSGPSAGKPWRRKPRLQVRLPAGYAAQTIRKALGVALALERGDSRINLENALAPTWESLVGELHDKISRLQATVTALSFDPLPNGVRSRAEALHVLGFPGDGTPGAPAIKNRFRMLAAIHHPDSEFGDTARMSQLNQAMALLKHG